MTRVAMKIVMRELATAVETLLDYPEQTHETLQRFGISEDQMGRLGNDIINAKAALKNYYNLLERG